MNKQDNKTKAAQLVALLNRQYCAIQRNLTNTKTAADTENEYEFNAFTKHGELLDAAFERTLAQLKEIGETVKFDGSKGEYFLGEKKYRIEFRVESVGYAEVEAPTEQIAMMKAERLADFDEIDLVQVAGRLRNVTESV